MQSASLPANEEIRLADLRNYQILDTVSEKEFDDLVELAAQICKCPISAITFVDKERQWFKAYKGLNKREDPRNLSFCAHTILQDEIMIVEDTLKDIRFFDNAWVTNDVKIRFYAGVAIRSTAGHNIGSICVINQKPQRLTKAQTQSLSIISRQITKLLELRLINIAIREKAENLLLEKQKVIKKNLIDQEQEKQIIGKELHENLAQALTCSKLYLDMAEQIEDMRLPFLKKAKEQQDKVLNGIRHLSQTIIPTTLANTCLKNIIEDYIYRITPDVPFDIHFKCTGNTSKIEGSMSVTLFRILEQQLSILGHRTNIKNVNIELAVQKEVSLTIKDDGEIKNDKEEKVATNCIFSRVELFNGLVKIKTLLQGSILTVVLPLLTNSAMFN